MIWLSIFLILSVLLNIAFFIGIQNIMSDLERYESYFEAVHASLKVTLDGMRSIDFRGAFEADDEVGTTFKGLLGLVSSLDTFISSE